MSETITSETISFDEIPYDWRVPSNFLEVRPNYSKVGLLSYPARALIIVDMSNANAGVVTTTGGNRSLATATPGAVYAITRDGQAAALFGSGSMAARMADGFRAANRDVPLDVMPVAPPAGATANSYNFTFVGSVAVSATMPFNVAGVTVPVVLDAGDTASDIAAACAAAINLQPNLLYWASSVGPVLVLNCLSSTAAGGAGVCGPALLDGQTLPPGVKVAGAQPTIGAGVLPLATALGTVATTWYTAMIVPNGDPGTYAALSAEMDRRYAATGKLDCHAYMGWSSGYGSLVGMGIGINGRHVTVFGAWNMSTPPAEMAAVGAGVCAYFLGQDPARQLRGLPLPGVTAPPRNYRWTPEEMDGLLRAGISPLDVLSDGTVVLTRVVTTYQRSPLGVLDTAWMDIMVPNAMSRIRYDWLSYLALRWPRAKLADDDSVAAEYDPTVATPKRVKGSWATRCMIYERQGWIENVDAMLADTVFVRDPDNRNRLNSRQPVTEVGNLMIFAGALEFAA